MINTLINEQVEKICKDYKIEKSDAKKIILEEIAKYKKLTDEWDKQKDVKKITRTSAYKDFVKKIRKKIYFHLRTYQKQGTTPESTHISTKERADHIQQFLFQINDVLRSSEVVFDVGGGMFLASFPFEDYKNIKSYIWLDKDKVSYEKILKYIREKGMQNVVLFNEKIGQRDWRNYLPQDKEKFDLVLMLKLVPVINRQERHLLVNLAQIPADYILVTGSKESMVKNKSIQKREEQTITSFITMSRKTIIKKINIENEFGYLIR